MTSVMLLDTLAERSEEAVKDLLMPMKPTKEDPEPAIRAPTVYKARLPDGKASTKYAPYILHTVINTSYNQPVGEQPQGICNVRTLFCVYSPDESKGGIYLLNCMERIRIDLMRDPILADQFQLDYEGGLEQLVYPDDTAPFYLGEMMTVWSMPHPVRREDWRIWLEKPDPNPRK